VVDVAMSNVTSRTSTPITCTATHRAKHLPLGDFRFLSEEEIDKFDTKFLNSILFWKRGQDERHGGQDMGARPSENFEN